MYIAITREYDFVDKYLYTALCAGRCTGSIIHKKKKQLCSVVVLRRKPIFLWRSILSMHHFDLVSLMLYYQHSTKRMFLLGWQLFQCVYLVPLASGSSAVGIIISSLIGLIGQRVRISVKIYQFINLCGFSGPSTSCCQCQCYRFACNLP